MHSAHRKVQPARIPSPRVRFVDLHAHTVVSDGTLTPADLVRLAAKKGLAAVAVTDHDHVGGVEEARRAALAAGVEVVPGIELSLSHAAGDAHLLGYEIDVEDAALLARLERLRESRARRAHAIVERLNALGLDVPMEDVAREASGEGAIGRPHVARVLVRRGHASSMQDAFDKWLADGRPAAVPKEKLTAREGIDMVRRAGGVAVLAHPVTLPEAAREPLVRELAKLGLAGIEVDHPRQDAALREKLRKLAAGLDLVATGGSDFHGDNKPDVELGMEPVPYAALERVRGRRPA